MNPVASNSQKSNKRMRKNQQGSALMLSLFIIIVLTLLGTTLVRVLSTSSETIAQEVIGTRALMAANSAMQAELAVLFPLATDAAIPHPIGTCNASKPHDLQASGSDIPGLYHCSASTTCDNYYTTVPDPTEPDPTVTQYYRLTSTGKCGSSALSANSKGIVRSSRTIQVEARSL